MSQSLVRLFNELQPLSAETAIGALFIQIMKIQYVPPGPDWHVPPHKHSSYEFHFITSGKGFVQMDGSVFTVNPGMFYLTGPEVVHAQTSDRNDPMDEICLQCQITLKENGRTQEVEEGRRLLDILNAPVYQGVRDTNGAIELFLQCAVEASSREVGFFSLIKNNVANLIIRSARALCEHQAASGLESRAAGEESDVVMAAAKFMQAYFGQPITLDDIAGQVYFSPRHLERLFRRVTGQTVNRYLTSIRLDRATHLLRETSFSLERIAHEIGFANGRYLGTLFKKQYGYSPGAYRAGCGSLSRMDSRISKA